MKEIPKEKLKELEEEVKKEFPGDYALQQVHLARLIIEEKTKGLTGKELIAYYRKQAKMAREKL
ncbi:MAG: hypothetical protein ACUVQP_11020 [Bacteroidales bacterium]